MKNCLPRSYTLADLLRVDPVGTAYREQARLYEEYGNTHKEERAIYKKVMDAANNSQKNMQAEEELLKDAGDTEESRQRKIAELLGVSTEELTIAERYQEGFLEKAKEAAPEASLIRSWRALKKRASIADIGPENFPTTFARPMLVLYSADWCPPCRIMRPTFARLVPFFDKAEVRYCDNGAWQQTCGITFIPQFAAYFPSGSVVCSHVPGTTAEIWDTMNNLIVLGKSWEGRGELVCTDEKCEIVSAAS